LIENYNPPQNKTMSITSINSGTAAYLATSSKTTAQSPAGIKAAHKGHHHHKAKATTPAASTTTPVSSSNASSAVNSNGGSLNVTA
jgi:hypothetical protein